MYELTVRELTQTQVLVFGHNENDPAVLLRLLADHVEASGCTILSVCYQNDDEGEYTERITATTECPWQS